MRTFARIIIVLFLVIAAMATSLLFDIPGGKRFKRYCSYPDMKALLEEETENITATMDYERDGTNYTLVVFKPCRFLASGPAVLVYDPDGRLFDKSGDEGDDVRFQRAWPRPWRWRHAETVRRLKTIVMPELFFYAPATMKDFVGYMNQATRDFDDPGVPQEKRGIKFVCKESVAAKTGPENQKSDVPLIPCPGVGTATTAWDVLTNVCESVGCKFVVRQGKVELSE